MGARLPVPTPFICIDTDLIASKKVCETVAWMKGGAMVAGTAAKRATLDDVAQGAGVSKATASKVLNGRGGVSGPTRQRVHDVMKELRYQPSTTHEAGSPTVELTVLFDAFESPY